MMIIFVIWVHSNKIKVSKVLFLPCPAAAPWATPCAEMLRQNNWRIRVRISSWTFTETWVFAVGETMEPVQVCVQPQLLLLRCWHSLTAGRDLRLLTKWVKPVLGVDKLIFWYLYRFSKLFFVLTQLTVQWIFPLQFCPLLGRQFCLILMEVFCVKEPRAALIFDCHLHLPKPLWLYKSCSFRIKNEGAISLYYFALPGKF